MAVSYAICRPAASEWRPLPLPPGDADPWRRDLADARARRDWPTARAIRRLVRQRRRDRREVRRDRR
jgi:hypothetical protein